MDERRKAEGRGDIECRQFREMLPQILESQTSPSVEAHSSECAQCGRLLAELNGLMLAAKDLPEAEPGPPVWANLRTSLLTEGFIKTPESMALDFAALKTAARSLAEFDPSPRLWTNLRAALVAEGLIPPLPEIAADFATLQSLAQDLPQVEPGPRVWQNLRACLAAEGLLERKQGLWERWHSRAMWKQWWIPVGALGSLAMILVALGVHGGMGHRAAPSVAAVTLRAPVLEGQPVVLAQLESRMEQSYDAERPSLDPSLKAAFDKGIGSADKAIRESQQSLESDPGNTLAQQYLESAYEAKARVLTAALELNDH